MAVSYRYAAFFLRCDLMFVRLHPQDFAHLFALRYRRLLLSPSRRDQRPSHRSTYQRHFNFPSSQAFKRFLCLKHRTRGGILRTNPAFVSDPFQGTTERSGCPGISKMESTPYMHVTAFCIVHACVFSPVAVTCISPKWSMQQPSPNHHNYCFML